jgi:hypothetical protein
VTSICGRCWCKGRIIFWATAGRIRT